MPPTPGERFCQHVSEYLIAHQFKSLGQIDRKQLASLYDDFQQQEKPARKSRVGQPKPSEVSDEEWVKGLYKLLAYEGLDVAREVHKCQLWARENNKAPSRRRIINWLNRETQRLPVRLGPGLAGSGQRPERNCPEPANWRERFRQTYPAAAHYAEKPWPEILKDKAIYDLVTAL